MKKFCIGMAALFCAMLLVSARQQNSGAESYEDFTRAIRANDLTALHKLAGSATAVNVKNNLHGTPLHYAAIYGSAEAVRLLLTAGADVGARNQQAATPLIYGAWDAARTKLLVDRDADVNAAANDGTTPLMISASTLGSSEAMRYLLANGADAKAMDMYGDDALIRAAGMSDAHGIEMLLAKGAGPRLADKLGFTALQMAAHSSDRGRVEVLLNAGADVNSFNTFTNRVKNGPIALIHLTPLLLAAPHAETGAIAALLKAGARVNEVDVRKMNPLMMAIATDHAKPGTVDQLIAAGADVNAKDQNGESALDWARKFNNPAILAVLEKAGAQGSRATMAPQPPDASRAANPTAALARTMPLLARTGPEFFKESGGCNGCHHQPSGARVYGAAVDMGVPVDDKILRSFKDGLLAERPRYLTGLPLLRTLPGDVDRLSELLTAMADLHMPANEFTDAASHYLAIRQDVSGAWTLKEHRPPMQDSSISPTAKAIRALRVYVWPARRAEFEERIRRAQLWLERAEPVTTYEEAERIMGLQAAGRSATALRSDAERLLSKQRPDGGWAQTQYLASDSYATGLTLHSLYTAGLLSASAPAYQKGVAFLLRTQFPDGSWYVRSRSPKLQPYFQSGFPFNHDQWISSTGTAWAAIALTHATRFSADSAPNSDLP